MSEHGIAGAGGAIVLAGILRRLYLYGYSDVTVAVFPWRGRMMRLTDGPAAEDAAQAALGATETAPATVPSGVHRVGPARTKRVVDPTTGRVRSSRTWRKDNREFQGFARRMIRAYARRAADADPTVLADMAEVAAELDRAMVTAVAGLRGKGYSWAEIARELGKDPANTARKWARQIGEAS